MRGKSILLLEPGSLLKRALGILRGGIRGRGDDLAVLRHELRTPLTGILGMAALLRESRLDTEQLQLLEALEQSGRQLADLLERPGAWLGTGTAKATVNDTAFNGLHLLEGITRAHWPVARHQGLGVFLVFDHRLAAFWRSDPGLLREALDNLLSNAIKFTPSGGYVLLEARRFGGNNQAGEGIELRVSDTGVGIPRRYGRRIYSFGWRGSEPHARRRDGSGYGLFICNRIAGALGGRLDHYRSRSGGACFTMRLHGIAPAFPAPTERLRPALLLGIRCQVLLPPPLDRVVAHALRRMGIAVCFQQRGGGEVWPESVDARICDSRPGDARLMDVANDGMAIPESRFPSMRCHPFLLGRPGSRLQGFSSALQGPVLHANLEPLMLQLALHARMNIQ